MLKRKVTQFPWEVSLPMSGRFCPLRVVVFGLTLACGVWAGAQSASETSTPQSGASSFEGGPGACEELPKGVVLSDEQLRQLIPDSAPGRVFIRWRTETQEDNYGFNIYRADKAEGPYKKINESIIPGEGSTNIPKDYCFCDKPLPRGKVFYYYIESISNSGVAETIAETKGTRVKVKTVAEEREWLRKKALPADAAMTSATASSEGATSAPAGQAESSATSATK